jgi:predicted kinase
VFIIFCGLPGTGKTTLARELARQLAVGEAGYRVGDAVAEDNLRLGRTVIADSMSPLRLTRDAWRDVAVRAGVIFVEVLVVLRPDRTPASRRDTHDGYRGIHSSDLARGLDARIRAMGPGACCD